MKVYVRDRDEKTLDWERYPNSKWTRFQKNFHKWCLTLIKAKYETKEDRRKEKQESKEWWQNYLKNKYEKIEEAKKRFLEEEAK